MPPEGYESITVDEETFDMLTQVVVQYGCDSVADAVRTSATVALQQEPEDLARTLLSSLESDTHV